MTAAGRRELAARKVLELQEKLAGIGAEFDGWLADAETGKPLRKHRTQIERLTDQLRGMAADIEVGIGEVSIDDDQVMASCRQLQQEMLEVHRIWDYFRSKLTLRYVTWFKDYLATADEFAWACYEPAQRAAPKPKDDVPRGGPLVFLSGDFSPFTYARETPFEVAEGADSRQSTLESETFRAVLDALPIPVIGVPWYQVAHVPDAVLIAHEVAHDVERDFGLTDAIVAHAEPALADVDPEVRFAWSNWLREVWADFYGVLAAGPAFVGAMRDLLVTNPQEVIADAHSPVGFGSYPPASLRMRLMTLALAKTGFEQQAASYQASWDQSFPAENGGSIVAVADSVVCKLLSGTFSQFGGRALREVVRFSTAQHETAVDVRGEALADQVPQSGDIKALVAGARLAFDADPELYARVDEHRVGSQRRIVDRAVVEIGDKTRARDVESEITREDDRRAGQALFRRLIRGGESS